MNQIGTICITKNLPKLLVARLRKIVNFHGEALVNPGKQDGFQVGTSKGNDNYPTGVSPQNFYSDNSEVLIKIAQNMTIYEDFISEGEENSFLQELEPYLKRLRYEFSHWDDAIHGYRETEKSNWNVANKAILEKVCELAFAPKGKPLRHVHVLDISKEGYIKPHIDSVRFCGDTIAGLSLLSSSIMRLACEKDKGIFVDILLKQRSLYIMKGEARFNYTHEILPDNLSRFKDCHVPRNRRISIICRNEPEVPSE